ncbi:MAG: FkbM family methyltransferase [Planctomycetota bacterium]|nr:FkbM family methyltransferase [Planctomycetota bacterium]
MARKAAWAWVKGDQEKLRRLRRQWALECLIGEADQLTFRRDGTDWTVLVSDASVTKSLFLTGRHQAGTRARVLEWLEAHEYMPASRALIVDVGANIGTPCVPLALGTGRRILAIEPVPENVELLRRNVERNGLSERVTCVHAAVASKAGKVTMAIHPKSGRSEVKAAGGRQGFGDASEASGFVEVPAETLDAVVAAHGFRPEQVAFVWCDTQGFEREVLQSATEILKAGAPFFMEFWPRGLEAHGGVAAFLACVQERFASFVSTEDLIREGTQAMPRPVSGLESFAQAFGERQTDLLLLPGAGRT